MRIMPWTGNKYCLQGKNDSYKYPTILIPEKIKEAAVYIVKDDDILKNIEGLPPYPKSHPYQNLISPQMPSKYKTVKKFKIKRMTDDIGWLSFQILLWGGFALFWFFENSFQRYNILVGYDVIQILLKIILFPISFFLSWSLASFFNLTFYFDEIWIDKNKDELDKEMIVYENEFKVYKDKIQSYEKEKAIIREQIESYRLKFFTAINKEKVRKVLYFPKLKPNSEPIEAPTPENRGKAELYFLHHLKSYFDSSVYMDLKVKYVEYLPDFVIIDKETGLCLDVEIDEPYTLIDKEPIHYDSSPDLRRDRFFLSENWVVIRFTEYQIIKYTKECCQLVKNIINMVKSGEECVNSMVPEQKKWTYWEAKEMAEANYRLTYLR